MPEGPDGAEPSGRPLVSLVLPTRDGGALLRDALDALRSQRAPFPFEIVAIDSGSTDGTAELLAARADHVLRIPPEDFDHGLTRNRAIAASRGELIVLTVQDAVPADPGWLRALVEPLLADPRLAATWARQVPRPDASRLTRAALGRWLGSRVDPRRSALAGPEDFLALPPAERHARCAFDDVCSCLRRSEWEEHPFRSTEMAEDLEWAREVLLAGREIAYVPEAVVVHSHDRSAIEELRRTILVHRRLAELFDLRTIPDLPALLRSWLATVPDHLRILRRGEGPAPGISGWVRGLALAFVWPLGQYLGGRRAGPFEPPNGRSPGRAR